MSATAVEPISLLRPVSEEAENRKKEAKKHFDAIRKSGGLVQVNSLRVGYHAYALKRDNMFGILGFDTEDDAREAAGVGRSTWYATIRLAEQFNGVSEELFCGMKQANAEALADLPESKRLTEYWVRMAATDSLKEFAEKVDKEMEGKARASDGKEPGATLKLSMPASRKKVVEQGLIEFAKEVGVEGDQGRALELMVAEHREGVSLIGAITQAVAKIAEIKKLQESDLSASEALEKVYVELDGIVETFRVALEIAQNNLASVE